MFSWSQFLVFGCWHQWQQEGVHYMLIHPFINLSQINLLSRRFNLHNRPREIPNEASIPSPYPHSLFRFSSSQWLRRCFSGDGELSDSISGSSCLPISVSFYAIDFEWHWVKFQSLNLLINKISSVWICMFFYMCDFHWISGFFDFFSLFLAHALVLSPKSFIQVNYSMYKCYLELISVHISDFDIVLLSCFHWPNLYLVFVFRICDYCLVYAWSQL